MEALKLTRAQQEERRLTAKEWLQQGTFSRQAIAEHFGTPIHTVGTWVTRLNQQRTPEAIVATGRPSRLTDEQREEIRTLLREGSRHHGYPDESWTTARVRDVIGRHLGIWYHRDHVRKLLHALGFTPQMPDGRAAERNEFRIASWKEQVAPELKKKVAEGATLVYLDEVGFARRACAGRPGKVRLKNVLVHGFPASTKVDDWVEVMRPCPGLLIPTI